ncbi:MAG: hypothetical protein [Caudoviricetes sp.]|nr:MAG: hypothetical protein [Caudoviricetes sp.]
MLVDVNFNTVTDEQKQKIIKACGQYIDLTPERIRKGIYYSDLNFQYSIEDKINNHPEFTSRDQKRVKQLQSRIDNKKPHEDIEYVTRVLAWELEKPIKVFPNKRKLKKLCRKTHNTFSSYGVCDNYEQILNLYDFEKDPRKFAIFLTPISKKHEPKEGGWRWERWGMYIGNQKSTADYLYYEEYIDMIFVYSIIEII